MGPEASRSSQATDGWVVVDPVEPLDLELVSDLHLCYISLRLG